ncbi:hypothetical protein GCM10010174_13560 [Kutzneria viridogrisea]
MAASTNAPEQIEAMRAPRSAAARIASMTSSGTGRATSSTPGSTTVSAPISPARPQSASTEKPPARICLVGAQTRTS